MAKNDDAARAAQEAAQRAADKARAEQLAREAIARNEADARRKSGQN